MNPQIRFGEDLMSRVSYAMMNPGGALQMTQAVRQALSELAAEVARSAGIPVELILEATVVAIPSCITCCSGSIRWSWAERHSRWRSTVP